MLEFTNAAVGQIAWTIGYEDWGAFHKVFHKVMRNFSQSGYRKRFGIAVRET